MASSTLRLELSAPCRYEIRPTDAMRVPGIVFASDALLGTDRGEAVQQVANVATLPGIVRASYGMPDIHLGYGFPIGGVAATDVDAGGVVSPGGVGYDISCGVRLLVAPFLFDEVDGRLTGLMAQLDRGIPRGAGPGGVWALRDDRQLRRLLEEGVAYAVREGYGTDDDLARSEEGGRLGNPDPGAVSEKALGRGYRQVGSLGSGNHFLEVERVDQVFDADVADAWGVRQDQITVMIHCGSRGLGHQVCSDHVKTMLGAMQRHGIELPDRQLACAPVRSPEGEQYLGAMASAANFGRANRQALTEAVRDAFGTALGSRDLRLLYDVSHNMARIEEHEVDGERRTLCVHRKGATRALPSGHPELPDDFRATGQPVIIPGSMGTSSWLLAGLGGEAFDSTCHGAGRAMSRTKARKTVHGAKLRSELESRGIAVRARSMRELAEEAPVAYKDVDEVVRVCEQVGLSKRVARLVPLGVVKG